MPVRLKPFVSALALSVLATGAAGLHAQTTPQLKQVLDQMDQAAAKFTSARADVSKDVETKISVISDHDLYTGSIYVERKAGKIKMGAVMKKDGKVSQVINYDGEAAQVFSAGTDEIDIYKSGNNQARFNSALTLGFGGSGKDLVSAWDVKDLGPETLSDGKASVKTEKLELVSKDAGVRKIYKTVTIWIDPTRSVSLKQVSVAPEGVITTAVYSNIKLAPKGGMSGFEIPKDKNTKTVAH